MGIEKELVRAIGDQIGYGRTMQLCEEIWREKGLDVIFESVPRDLQCSCPKFNIGEGYEADGEPFFENPIILNVPEGWEGNI